MSLLDELFSFSRKETPGERMHAWLYEAFLVAATVATCWAWTATSAHVHNVIRAHGIAHYVSIQFLFGPGAYWNAALVSVAAMLGFTRIAPRLGYSVALAGFHLQCVARYAQGKLCHDANFLGMAVLGACVAMWLYRDPMLRRRYLVGASYFFIGLSYLSAAASKLIASGPGWVDGRHLWLWIGEKSVDAYSEYGVLGLNGLQQLLLDHRALATALLSMGLLTELSGPLFWLRRTRPYAALACIGMHVGIYFSMNILFDTSIYLVALLGLPWAALLDRHIFAARLPVPTSPPRADPALLD